MVWASPNLVELGALNDPGATGVDASALAYFS